MTRARFTGLVCLFVLCSAVFGEEDFERMLELYGQSAAERVQRLRDYAELQELRRATGERHLPAGTQFDFARESFRAVRAHAPGTDANGCAWTSAGPTNLNGRVISIAIDPTDNQNIYAGTVGGIWRSTNAGRRWQRVSDDLPADRFSAVAVNPGAPNEVFAGAGDRNLSINDTGSGLYRSISHGAPGTWTKATVTEEFKFTTVYRIRIDPQWPHDVYVAASNGVWIGQHGGGAITFIRVGGFDANTHDIAVDFSDYPRKIYAGVRENSPTNPKWTVGIHKFDGMVWYQRDSGIDLTDAETFSLALAESNPKILYAKVSQRSDGTLVGLYKTITAAEGYLTWKPLPIGLPGTPNVVPDEIMGWYNTMFEVDPTNPERVFAGGIHMYMSPDGGATWDDVSWGKDPDYQLEAHADFHALAFDPKNPNIIYVGNDGGIDRTDLSKANWHWTDVSHGMVISMFYFLTSNRNYPTLLAGGLQDNGTAITFGNRTWYNPEGCDGFDVGSDAGNPDTIYANCNNGLIEEFVNPVIGTPGGPIPELYGKGDHIAFDTPSGMPLRPPVITDMVTPKAALAGGGFNCATRTILRTTDGVKFEATNTNFLPGSAAIALASSPAPQAAFKTYLAAVAYRPAACLNFQGVSHRPYVIRTDDAGVTWEPVTGLPTDEPSSLAFDPYDKFRSYVTYRNSERLYMSTGGQYEKIAGSFPNALPSSVRKVVVDPFDTNVLYAATSLGVYRGVVTLSSPPTAIWKRFNHGLPDSMEINDLWVDPDTGILTIGSFGYGAFRRDIRQKPECSARMLVVRDTVYDDGREPTASIADPEHPIKIAGTDFYKPDNTMGGKAWWWTSRDIRVDVPANVPYAHQIDDADSVEFELCPTAAWHCLAGAMIDSPPEAFKAARVYIQVTNRGVEPVPNTRVIALWHPKGAAFESLPPTFWTQTFPANGECGPLDPVTGWQLVDPGKPCRTIDSVTPDMPELARFDWTPPIGADGGATLLTVVEAPGDPLDASIRDQNKLSLKEIVPGSRHIALRSLHIKPFDARVRVPFLWPLDLLKLPEEMEEVEVVVSKVDLREGVHLVLPAGLTARAGFGSVRQTRVTDAELVRQLESMRLDPNNAWELSGDEASLFVDLAPGQRVTTALIATPPEVKATTRLSIVERSRGVVVGGSVMVLRPQM